MILRHVVAHFRNDKRMIALIPARAGTQQAPAGAPEVSAFFGIKELGPGLRRDERFSLSIPTVESAAL